VKLFCISFISACGQFQPLVSYFSLVCFILIFFNDTRSLRTLLYFKFRDMSIKNSL